MHMTIMLRGLRSFSKGFLKLHAAWLPDFAQTLALGFWTELRVFGLEYQRFSASLGVARCNPLW